MTMKQGNAGIEVGDVFLSVWGYEQTNVAYYQVTRIVGKTMVEVKEINHKTTTEESEDPKGGRYYNYSPAINNFKSDEIIKRKVLHYGSEPTIEINDVIAADLIEKGNPGMVSTNPYFN